MTSRFTSGATALTIAGLLLVGTQVPASAQQSEPGRGSERCSAAGGGPGNAPGNAPQYPPAQGSGVSDSSPSRGQQMNATSGCREFAPGQRVAFGVESVFQQLGSVIATVEGEANASFVVPTNLPDGRHHVVFRGLGFNGAPNEVRIPFFVTGGPLTNAPGTGTGAGPETGTGAGPETGTGAGSETGTGAGSGQGAARGDSVTVAGVSLPRTGSDEIVPLTALGLGLVVGGAGMVLVARRRRTASTLA